MKNLMQAIAQMHKKHGVLIKKDAKNNRNKYASLVGILDQINDMCKEFDIVLTQDVDVLDGFDILVTRIFHTPSGEEKIGRSILTPKGDAQIPDQSWGGSTTYHRRYCAMMGLGIFAEDDPTDNDGHIVADKSNLSRGHTSSPISTPQKPKQGCITEPQSRLLYRRLKELGKEDLLMKLNDEFGSLQDVSIKKWLEIKPDIGLD